MCVARKSGPGREYSVAVDWRDCAWSPRIVVRRPVAAHPGSPFKNAFSRSSRGNEAQISLEMIIRLEPPHQSSHRVLRPAGVGCYFFNGPPGCALRRLVTKRSPASSSISPPPRRNRIYF
jgi:hypothetical protein